MDLKDLNFNQLVIEWLRYHIPRYMNKNLPIMVADEIDKIPSAISIKDAYLKNDELNIELTNNQVINLGNIKGDVGIGIEGPRGIGIKNIKLIEGHLIIILDNDNQFDVGNVIGPKGPKGDSIIGPPPEHRYVEKDNCIQFKQPDGEWGICIPIIDKRTIKVDNMGGSIGQPVLTKLAVLFNNIIVDSNVQKIDFTGSVNVTKVQDKFVRVEVASGLIWETITVDTILENNKGYIIDGAMQLNLTLPDNCEVGDTIEILMGSTQGFNLVPAMGIDFYMGKKQIVNYIETVPGQINSALAIKCNYANLKYIVTSSQGNFTIT